MQRVVDGSIVVTLQETRQAMKLIAEKSRAIAEGAGALALAAALTGKAGEGPIVCVVSGGTIDLAKFAELVTAP
jgi:threonine dehydratase